MEKMFDFGVDLLLPMFSSSILQALEDIQKEQNPPYSEGVYFTDLRRRCIAGTNVVFNYIMPALIDPVVAALFKSDAMYANTDLTKYSICKVNDDYMRFTEGINHKFPGY